MSRASGSDVGERRPVAEALEVGLDRDAGPAHRVAALAADGDDGEVAGWSVISPGREPDRVRVERPGQAAVGRHEDDQPLAAFAPGEQRMVVAAEDRRRGRRGPRRASGCTAAACERRVLGALELGRGHELHRPGDLLDVADGGDPPPDLALAGHLGEEALAELDERVVEGLAPARRSGSSSCRARRGLSGARSRGSGRTGSRTP